MIASSSYRVLMLVLMGGDCTHAAMVAPEEMRGDVVEQDGQHPRKRQRNLMHLKHYFRAFECLANIDN